MNTTNKINWTSDFIRIRPARKMGSYKGKQVYNFQVVARVSGLDREFWATQASIPVISPTAAEACALVAEELLGTIKYPFELECMGPKGGMTYRNRGWFSVCGAAISAARPTMKQLRLELF
jgi:hypothetical protein